MSSALGLSFKIINSIVDVYIILVKKKKITEMNSKMGHVSKNIRPFEV